MLGRRSFNISFNDFNGVEYRKGVLIFNPEIIFTLVDEKPTDGVGYFMISGKEYLKLATKKLKYETLKSLVNQGLSRFFLYVGNRVTGYNLFEGSNPLLSARSHKN